MDSYFREPRLEDYWRGIVLFGRNVASYKFALAKSLLDLNPQAGQLIKLHDLAPHFAGHIAKHIKNADKQATSSSSRFLDACRQFNSDGNENNLVEATVRLGFNNVIDAFHILGNNETPKRFFVDERKSNNGVRITDEFSKMLLRVKSDDLYQEVESRWRLVETAWEIGVSRGLLRVDHDETTSSLFAVDRARKRIQITSSRNALNGYQKGRCFYCCRQISISDNEMLVDVDHFFPHVLKQFGFNHLIDGVWNLVLSCRDCNRGSNGKFARVPSERLLDRLQNRNEYLIGSHHPLRETLLMQTGNTYESRSIFLKDYYQKAWDALIHRWEPDNLGLC